MFEAVLFRLACTLYNKTIGGADKRKAVELPSFGNAGILAFFGLAVFCGVQYLIWLLGPILGSSTLSDATRDRHQLFAAVSLVRRGAGVELQGFETGAASPSGRWRMWRHLSSVGLLRLFPKLRAAPWSLAEAEMVQWLEHAIELGEPPLDICPVVAVDYRVERRMKPQRMFVFQFQADRGDGPLWDYGAVRDYPTKGNTSMDGSPCSRYARIDESKLDDEVVRLLGNVAGWAYVK